MNFLKKELLEAPVCPVESKEIRDFLTHIYTEEAFFSSMTPMRWMNEEGPLRLAICMTAIEWLTGQGPLCFDYMTPQFPSADLVPSPAGEFPSVEERAAALANLATTLSLFEKMVLHLTDTKEYADYYHLGERTFSYEDNNLLKSAQFYADATQKLIELITFMDKTDSTELPALFNSFLKDHEREVLRDTITVMARTSKKQILPASPALFQKKTVKP